MPKKILRQELLMIEGDINLPFPVSKIVKVQMSESRPGQVVNVWYEIPVGEEPINGIRTFRFFRTAEEIPDGWSYLGSVIAPGIGLHLCELTGITQ